MFLTNQGTPQDYSSLHQIKAVAHGGNAGPLAISHLWLCWLIRASLRSGGLFFYKICKWFSYVLVKLSLELSFRVVKLCQTVSSWETLGLVKRAPISTIKNAPSFCVLVRNHVRPLVTIYPDLRVFCLWSIIYIYIYCIYICQCVIIKCYYSIKNTWWETTSLRYQCLPVSYQCRSIAV